MQTSTIKFSQIEDRIDAEYYKPEYLILNSKLKTQNSKFLDDLSQVITKGETPLWRGDVYVSKGMPFLRVVNFINEELDLSDIVYIPEFVHERMKRSQLKPGDVLLSMAGRIGTAVIVPEELKIANINQAIAKIRLKEGLINKYYLIVFLNSKYGLYQSLRKASGGVQNNINFEDIKSIKIPIVSQPFQQKIEKMVKEAQKKRKLADEKYKEAEEILNKELGLENLDLSTQKTFEAKFSEAEDRFDPEYYQPKYKKIISKLKVQKAKVLGEIVKINNKKLDPTKNPSAEIKYVELANINGSNGIIGDCETYKHWQLPGRARMLIRNGDVLVSSLGGSIDKVGLATEEYDGQVASTGFFVVNSDVLNSETLFLIFRNKIISGQLERNTRGAIMSAISENEFKNILIPIISKPVQRKISSLIQESFRIRKESKDLIRKAKKEVEETVERGNK